MNRSLLTLLAYLLLAALTVAFMRWLRNRQASAPPTAAGRVGPPLAGTETPLPGPLEPHRARLEALLVPAVRLVPGGAQVARLGGAARLPEGVEWPASPARPMSWIAELDLAALRRAAPEVAPLLPPDGRLALFYDVEEMRWGFDAGDGAFFRLLHLPAGGEERASPRGATAFEEVRLGARAIRVLPGPEELPLRLDGAAEEAYLDHAAALAPEPDHRVGGPPAWIQNDGREDAAITAVGGSTGTPDQAREARERRAPGPAAEWHLLWQIDSDPTAGMMWGDAGRLYLLARDEDVKARRFDRVWLVLQCF